MKGKKYFSIGITSYCTNDSHVHR